MNTFLANLCQSLKQRLGKSNIQARLGRPVGALMRGGAAGGRGGMRGMARGGLRGRLRGGTMRGALSLRGEILLPNMVVMINPVTVPTAAKCTG